ncbi:MAG TPA: hypothetical protein VFM30_07030, partial [Steroidobacteraceae bacterium]|nr:hypothetical protein [Steroidobacteraceae bacterium]
MTISGTHTTDSNVNATVPDEALGISRSARILLRRVFRILRGCGISEAELRSMAKAAVDEIEKIPESQPSRVTVRQAMLCCDVVLDWRRNPKFLDVHGAP